MSELMTQWPDGFRAGFACIVGRPNAGKSTLTNALVGQKVAITSARPETTRRVIRAIVNREDGQIILVDTPGLHRPRTLLGERLNDMVRDSLSDVDVVVVCLPADEPTGKGDRFLLEMIKETRTPVIAAVTKSDKVTQQQLAERLIEVSTEADFAEIVPVSAINGDQVDVLSGLLLARMPDSPPLYPRDAVTDESEETLIAELIREAALEELRDELPHSIAVTIEEILEEPAREKDQDQRPLIRIHANLHVERDSQKGIVIGRGGSRLRQIGQDSRRGIQRLLDTRVYLDLHVKVTKDWQRDPKKLGRLGF
ncbi:GTPase Era [Changpingibacter yushuensis]|uniref:GTPase Era n=1 Tax=Changpingibacter yushuensis TaxID=2758440 RepID=UPI0021CD404B|nr:GTPase Era [Changpingibacter yushuensis]